MGLVVGSSLLFCNKSKRRKPCAITFVFRENFCCNCIGDPAWAKYSLAFRIITLGHVAGSFAFLNTIWSVLKSTRTIFTVA